MKTLIGGYALVTDLFGEPLFVMRVDTSRPIHERGKLSQFYLFGTVFAGTILFSLVILFFLQRFVLVPIKRSKRRRVESIGKRKAIAERVHVTSRDELIPISSEASTECSANCSAASSNFSF